MNHLKLLHIYIPQLIYKFLAIKAIMVLGMQKAQGSFPDSGFVLTSDNNSTSYEQNTCIRTLISNTCKLITTCLDNLNARQAVVISLQVFLVKTVR